MAQLSIPASSRTAVGKGPNRRLRATGMIPAVVYGGAAGTRALAVSPRHVTEIVRSPRGVNTIFSLEIDGEASGEKVMIHDYQLHPLDHSVLHADLMRVDPDKASDWHVPVHLKGESPGVKRGGHLDFITRSLAVSCLPHDIPESLPLAITELDYGDTVRAADIELPESLTLATDRDVVIVHVSPPKGTDEPEEEEESVEEEPEE
jgi:large subunit ribosomal protein L25